MYGLQQIPDVIELQRALSAIRSLFKELQCLHKNMDLHNDTTNTVSSELQAV
jgi:hypothetical protein